MTTTDVHKGKTIEREKEEGEMKGQREKADKPNQGRGVFWLAAELCGQWVLLVCVQQLVSNPLGIKAAPPPPLPAHTAGCCLHTVPALQQETCMHAPLHLGQWARFLQRSS
ncbi:hypothetical protein CgunFtcFv8_011821 [Champsocephalus gunnari]|uniref:Uncharacterized protein n=1 Tax=Champsocephalus gunnari TaxID=52237 RepID=A0AAN8HM04_CHAGU|nr:hypothetical protein CgunFtcFv8_011821 [Champsocephalus gunnari]